MEKINKISLITVLVAFFALGIFWMDATVPVSGVSPSGTIKVMKTVINDNGGTKTAADFPIFISGTSVDSDVAYSWPAPEVYFVTEAADPNYAKTFSGDCDMNGLVNLNVDDNKVCVIINNDIGSGFVPRFPDTSIVPRFPNTGFAPYETK